MSPEKLVYMANQIGKFFAHQGEDKAAVGIADHLRKFWSPAMRGEIVDYVVQGRGGLDPAVVRAIQSLKSL